MDTQQIRKDLMLSWWWDFWNVYKKEGNKAFLDRKGNVTEDEKEYLFGRGIVVETLGNDEVRLHAIHQV